MTGTEGVMLAFAALGEAGKTAVLTQRRKLLPASGDNFMDIGLVTYVENNLIFRRIENLMQGQSQLYHAQVRRQMAPVCEITLIKSCLISLASCSSCGTESFLTSAGELILSKNLFSAIITSFCQSSGE